MEFLLFSYKRLLTEAFGIWIDILAEVGWRVSVYRLVVRVHVGNGGVNPNDP